MNKAYLLTTVRTRIAQLESEYRQYFDLENGPCKSYSGAACSRSRIKKDLGILNLIERLLNHCPSTMTLDDDEEVCKAFDRLVEPRRLK